MKEEVKKLFFELYNEPFERGYPKLVEDLDIDVDLYEDYIMGIVSSWLKGSAIEKDQIDRGEDLDKRLDLVIERVLKYKDLKKKIDHMVELMLEDL